MEHRKLELTLLSAENLKEVNLISRLNVYAVVSVGNDPQYAQTIPPDRLGGRNPVWNSTIHLPLPARAVEDPCSRLALRIALRTERALGDRDVGDVTVPVWDLVRDNPYGDVVRSLSWMVRKPMSAKTKGVLNFSYKIVGGTKDPPPVVVRAGSKRSGSRRGGLVWADVVFFDKAKAAGC